MAAAPSPGRLPSRSSAYSLELQRARLLSATFALVGERGYEGVSSRSVSERAGVSSRTFYEVFSDREDCFLAAFDYAVDGLETVVRPAYESQDEWVAKIREGLAELLETLEREPAVRRLVCVEALGAGPRVLARRARVLEGLAGVIDEGRAGGSAPASLPRVDRRGSRRCHVRGDPRPPPGGEPRVADRSAGSVDGDDRPSRTGAARSPSASSNGPHPSSPREPARGRVVCSAPRSASASPVDYRLTARARMALAAVAGAARPEQPRGVRDHRPRRPGPDLADDETPRRAEAWWRTSRAGPAGWQGHGA